MFGQGEDLRRERQGPVALRGSLRHLLGELFDVVARHLVDLERAELRHHVPPRLLPVVGDGALAHPARFDSSGSVLTEESIQRIGYGRRRASRAAAFERIGFAIADACQLGAGLLASRAEADFRAPRERRELLLAVRPVGQDVSPAPAREHLAPEPLDGLIPEDARSRFGLRVADDSLGQHAAPRKSHQKSHHADRIQPQSAAYRRLIGGI